MSDKVAEPTAPPTEHLGDVNQDLSNARVAVVGAGPAGLYATQSLLESSSSICVDVFDKLPTPYGLVRYGIAPDNRKMKSVTRVLQATFDQENRARFFGNVRFGADINRADLLKHYDAVIYSTGAQGERRLDIPGEDLPGSYSAKDFVNWYNGHPDAAEQGFRMQAKHAAVIGAGNVALDIARVLVRDSDALAATDVPDRVLEALSNSQITDVHLIARRGPAQAKFTPVELRGIGEIDNSDVVIHPEELILTEEEELLVSSNRHLRTNINMLRDWADRPLKGKARRIHIRFLRSPVLISGENCVEAVSLESVRRHIKWNILAA